MTLVLSHFNYVAGRVLAGLAVTWLFHPRAGIGIPEIAVALIGVLIYEIGKRAWIRSRPTRRSS